MMAAAKLDEYWSHLRLCQTDLPGRKFLLQAQEAYQRVSVQRQTVAEVAHEEVTLASPRLAEALVRYVGHKGAGRVDTFRRAAERACGYLVDAAGEKPLADYTRSDALSLRDYLVAKGLSGSSITRILGSIRAVINFNIGELALSHGNPFVSVYYDRSRGVKKRATIPEVSDVSAHGTVWRDCIAEDLRLIFTPNGVEDDEETRDDEGPSREGCEGHPACDAQAA
jgi:hypothetical protein